MGLLYEHRFAVLIIYVYEEVESFMETLKKSKRADAFACGAGAQHVARDLVLVLPIRHSGTTPQGGVEGRVAGGGLADFVGHYWHLDLL